MNARVIGFAAFVLALGAGPSAFAQGACDLHRVNTSLLNISHQPGGETYKDALFDGDSVCVAQQQAVGGRQWAYIASKVGAGDARTLVDGWAPMDYLQRAAPGAAAAPPAAAPAPTPQPPPAAAVPGAVPGGGAVAGSIAGPPIRPEDTLRFDQPIPFGPFPVNGRSLRELIDMIPLFSPIEGVEEALWKKNCTACHQWDQARLCEQAATYVANPKHALRVPHPFGGSLQIALMRWAKSGCG
jgi:hypothetical protein